MRKFLKGKLLEFVTKKQKLPNGRIASLEIIKHPGAVLIVPFLSKDKIIVLRQFRPVIGKYLYELPAGTINPLETQLECARRELIEETGFAAQKFTLRGKIYPVPGYSTEIIWIFEAAGLKKQSGMKDPDEIIKVCTFNPKQIRKMFQSGQIHDAKTICGLSFCHWL